MQIGAGPFFSVQHVGDEFARHRRSLMYISAQGALRSLAGRNVIRLSFTTLAFWGLVAARP